MSYCARVLQYVYCSMPQLVTSQLYLKTTGMSNSFLPVLLLLIFLCLSIPCAASLFQSHWIQSVCSHLHRNLSSHRPQGLRVIALLPSILGNSMNGIHILLLPCSLTCLTSATLSKPQSQKSLSCEKQSWDFFRWFPVLWLTFFESKLASVCLYRILIILKNLPYLAHNCVYLWFSSCSPLPSLLACQYVFETPYPHSDDESLPEVWQIVWKSCSVQCTQLRKSDVRLPDTAPQTWLQN